MSVVRFRRNVFSPFISKCYEKRSVHIASNEEYTSEPIYPKIEEKTKYHMQKKLRRKWADDIKELDTVEEKIFKINMPKYYGWKSVMLSDDSIPLHSLGFVQHCTRTHFIQQTSLPEAYIAYDSAASFISKQIRSEIEDAVYFEYQGIRRNFKYSKNESIKQQEEDFVAASVLRQINRILLNHLSPTSIHLMDSQVDINPRLEAFWFVGNFQPPFLAKIKKGFITRPENNHKTDRAMQFIGKPSLTLRSTLPLEPLIPYSEADNPSLEVPSFNLDPRTLSFRTEFRHGSTIPGFWPGDSHEYGLLSYHTRGHLHNRFASFGPEDTSETITAQAILNSYSWLLSQACYHGFSTYNDVTYPFTTQTVITNGQIWSLFSYQLNTTLLSDEYTVTNKLRNICYGTPQMKLFEGIDNDGKLVGFNDDLLKMLIQFYLNTPIKRENTNMKPYLGEKVKLVADIEHDEKRNWLESRYKHMISNRKRHRLLYEVYLWEKIYKIKFNTRFAEARRRPFELHTNPFKRTMDQHTPEYIPKALRPRGTWCKQKWAKTYYP